MATNSDFRGLMLITGRKHDFNTVRLDAHVFFKCGEKPSPFSKISGYVWTRPKKEMKTLNATFI